jgi:hypothetical protein
MARLARADSFWEPCHSADEGCQVGKIPPECEGEIKLGPRSTMRGPVTGYQLTRPPRGPQGRRVREQALCYLRAAGRRGEQRQRIRQGPPQGRGAPGQAAHAVNSGGTNP